MHSMQEQGGDPSSGGRSTSSGPVVLWIPAVTPLNHQQCSWCIERQQLQYCLA